MGVPNMTQICHFGGKSFGEIQTAITHRNPLRFHHTYYIIKWNTDDS